MTDTDRSQPLNVPRGARSSRYRTHSSGSLSSSFGSPSGLTNINNNNGGTSSVHNKKQLLVQVEIVILVQYQHQ